MSAQEEIDLEFLEVEDLLLRTVPGLAEQWLGATPDEVEQLKRLAGRPLPRFYRWFLSRMGRSMGPLAYPSQDFSARRVLDCYARKLVAPNPRFLLIGYEFDEMVPLHAFYDLDAPARGDATVTARYARGGDEPIDRFETFHEMLSWSALFRFRFEQLSQKCEGTLYREDADLLSLLAPVLGNLGFTQSITTGRYCGLYERADAVMMCGGTPRENLENVRTFLLGGSNAGVLRRILGEVAKESSLEVEVNTWTPAPR